MAYQIEQSRTMVYDGRRHWHFRIVETASGPADEWSLDPVIDNEGDIPHYFTVTSLRASLTTPGSATTIQPELGRKAGWVSGDIDHINAADTAAANIHELCFVPVSAPAAEDRTITRDTNNRIFGRSRPDAAAGEIITEITIVEGHWS